MRGRRSDPKKNLIKFSRIPLQIIDHLASTVRTEESLAREATSEAIATYPSLRHFFDIFLEESGREKEDMTWKTIT